ncbi:MAG TPA: uridine kinase [Gemmatimonadales bacterium]
MARPVLIGIAGGSGAGKTTVAGEISRGLGPHRVVVIPHDAYYHDRSTVPPAERNALNFDHPDALETTLLVEHLHALRAGHAVEIPEYDFATHMRTARRSRVTPHPVIVVEGILLLADPALRAVLDLKVFVDSDADIRFIRRLTRDCFARGRSAADVAQQYLATVRPMHVAFVEPSRRHAEVVIADGAGAESAVATLVRRVEQLVDSR